MIIAPNFSEQVLQEMTIADELIMKLRNFCSSVDVAGGAPRDWFFNKISTDIDIFIDSDKNNDELGFELQALSDTPILLQTGENLPAHYVSEYISSVFTFDYKRKRIQVITKATPRSNILETFPCSLSMISYKDLAIVPEPIFMDTVTTGCVKFTKTCPPKYIQKIMSKFYGYRIQFVNRLRTSTSSVF